ncbi:MAG: YkgJ family cysteine cluster protein [Rhodocyclaceae bacterium]|nr:YkgJ family cysteine cluster protein [Rhodocyclaceae bacterium]
MTSYVAPECRQGCGACCIAPSISSPIPGMPSGKPANVRCVHLDEQHRCKLFGSPERPQVCRSLQPERTMCGDTNEHAFSWLRWMEVITSP